jgi:acetolactate synthase-1/2/3 large subunit
VCRIDISPAQLHKNLDADIPVLGDAADSVGRLVSALQDSPAAPAGDRADDPADNPATGAERAAVVRAQAEAALESTAKHHRWIHDVLAEVLAGDDVVVGDSSQVTYQGSVHLWPASVPDSLIAPASFATLGFAVPAAVGALVADSGRRVVALLGDGALMFSVQELRTAADLGRPLPVLVVDNGGYREIAEEMDAAGIPRLAVDLPGPEYAELATAMGCAYADGSTPEHLRRALTTALGHPRPTLIRIQDRTPASEAALNGQSLAE